MDRILNQPDLARPAPLPGAADGQDWAATAFGPVESWPQSLRTAASMVLGAATPMFIGWGPDFLMLYNEAYAEILGDREPAMGRPGREVWADIWDRIRPNAERALAGETLFFEADPRILRRGGREKQVWMTFGYNPIIGEDGTPAGVFGTVIAVGDASAEQRIRESEERFRLIADSAPVPIWVTKLDRTRGFVNRAYVDFIGVSYEDAVDYDWRHIIHPDDQPRIHAESLAGEASLQHFVLEGRFRRGDGEWRWLRSISQPRWGPGGEHIGFIGVAHDITEWKLGTEVLEARVAERTADLRAAIDRLQAEVGERERAEEALRQAQKMEAVGQLTGGIAHDFNNLLTPVIGGLEIISRSLEEPRLKRIAEAALESGRRGAKLTSQLLAFSRIQRIRMVPVRVNKVIDTMRLMLKHSIGSAITIRTELDPAADRALCDENQLENAILNLAINARDAMLADETGGGGILTISTGVTQEPDGLDLAAGDYVCVAVADTGQGMTAEVVARATEPFFSTKPLGKGTGLGLAQVYGIVRQAGGTMRIESREGEGTIVRLLLPKASGDALEDMPGEGEAGAAGLAPGGGARIFVVDDDEDVREFLADALVSLGHRVETLAGGAATLAALDEGTPDLVLVDFAMPGMNGAELAREIRARFPDLPIVFVTGFAESDQLEGACGADVPVLRKPFGIDDLSAMVASQLTRS
ncbi:MAG TPA: response regulator [Allosphingosinicella sp.]|jgi:PAS domain S-box-containing protein|nr:response regulator [Allosphingosinicella sp.]